MKKLIETNHSLGIITNGPRDRLSIGLLSRIQCQYFNFSRICSFCENPGRIRVTATLKTLPQLLFISCKRVLRYCGRKMSGPSARSNRPVIIERL